ncbi:MAG TPA: phosphatase PAP2 family protein [Clostridiales bacterium]|nr:phosphatase PAP2 family protein [Clostridiales bacterium]
METIKKLIYKYRHFGWLALFGITLALYGYCERNLVPKYIIESVLDDYIPFIKEFIIPYLFWFIYMAAAILYFGLKSVRDYYRLVFFMFTGMLVCYIIYILFPNGLDLRPEVSGNDIFSRLVKFIHGMDTPTNVCPSIHVFNSIAVHLAVAKSSLFENRKGLKTVSTICMILICASTVFVKQHSIIDLIWGVVLGIVCYIAFYRLSGWLPGWIQNFYRAQDTSVLEK